jgi:hypothetical protein
MERTLGSQQLEVAENPTFEALHRKGDATCPRSYTATCQRHSRSDRVNERIVLIWSDRVNSAKSVGMFCSCLCVFSRTERAAAGAVLSDD